MWGNTKEATDLLLHTHVLLADRLSGDKWKRVQIWRGHTSVHEWGFGSRYFAFDIVPSVKHTSVTLISRDVDAIDLLKEGLKCEGVSFKTVDKRPERLLIRVFHHPDNPPPVGEIVSLVQAVRKAVELSLVDFRSWLDPDTSISIPYAVKPQRKSCSELVFLFSSIRSKPHWLDFEGPLGKSLASNRARIVFMHDNFASTYTYHMAVDGSTDIWSATVRFIADYVESNGYSWEKVTLCGMSKGGTSAILTGSFLPKCTVLALAPQLKVGDYLVHSKRWNVIAAMAGEVGRSGASSIDRLMWDGLEGRSSGWGIQNCYILTSLNDPHCTQGLDRLRTLLERYGYGRLHLSVDKSEHTTSHLKTVHYLAPQFISLLGLLTSGLRPSFSDGSVNS